MSHYDTTLASSSTVVVVVVVVVPGSDSTHQKIDKNSVQKDQNFDQPEVSKFQREAATQALLCHIHVMAPWMR